MSDGETKTCPVVGCTRHTRGVPMCRPHWTALASSTRRRLRELEECDPVAFGVALVLTAEALSEEAPAWASGWSGEKAKRVSHQQRRARMIEAQRTTCERMRQLARRRPDEYAERTAAWREELGRIAQALGGKFGALEVALAMIRGGQGTDGFCRYLVSAGLELDEERAGQTALAGA